MNGAVGTVRRRTGRRIAVAALVAVAFASCGDDTTGEDSVATTAAEDVAPTTDVGDPVATSDASTTAPTGGRAASALVDADRAAITDVFTAFFGGDSSTVDTKVEVLQDGERYRDMLEDASANAQFQQMATDIREIRDGEPSVCAQADVESPCAVVVHDLTVGGVPMAAAIESVAVFVGDGWLVSSDAWCSIVELGGERCP